LHGPSRRTWSVLGLLAILVAGGASAQQPTPGATGGRGPLGRATAIQQGEACPAGTTEVRPRSCAAPELPPPSIVDYRPRSTLVTPTHLVRHAKYPAIDFHGHPQDLVNSAEGLATLGAALDSLNVRMMIAADNYSGERLQRAVAGIRSSPQ